MATGSGDRSLVPRLLGALTIVVATLIALVVLWYYDSPNVVAEDLALGAESRSTQEVWKGKAFTGYSISVISSITAALSAANLQQHGNTKSTYLLWLGNSQLHAINQAKVVDHLSPYELRSRLPDPDHTVPLGFSLASANFQEYLTLGTYVMDRLPIQGAIIALVFNVLREDGLRGDFSHINSPTLRLALSKYQIGKEILTLAEASRGEQRAGQENPGLEGFVQKEIEDALSSGLADVWPLWGDRPNLRARLMNDSYWLRNWVLGIKPTDVRKMIGPRYARNMAALTALLEELQDRGIPVVLYIAPIRQDHPLPYDLKEYSTWKTEVASLAEKYSARLLNLETLVPPQYWGTYHEDDIDFMHFQGKGHQLLAQALLPHVEAMLDKGR